MKPLPISTRRECGACTACCNAIPIRQPDLDKGPFTDCPHLVGRHEHACRLHDSEQFPRVCSDYSCLWLLTPFPDEYRPDLLGLIFDGTHGPTGDAIQERTGLISCVAHEVRPGAAKEDLAGRVVEWLVADLKTVVLIHTEEHGDLLKVNALAKDVDGVEEAIAEMAKVTYE